MQGLINKCSSVLLATVAVSFLLIHAVAGQVTELRDIRIGEYQDYTRIVLEFDSNPHLPVPPKLENGFLTVTIASASPRLVRRIPIENVERIKNLEIITRKDNLLEIHIAFKQKHGRLKLFSLQNPFRLGLDLLPIDYDATESRANTKIPNNVEKLPEPVVTKPVPVSKSSLKISQSDRPKPASQPIPTPSDGNAVQGTDSGYDSRLQKNAFNHPAQPQQTIEEKALQDKSGNNQSAPVKTPVFVQSKPPDNALAVPRKIKTQFYLVAGLVLLTIVILGLLAVILLIRKQTDIDSGQLPIDELLRKQERQSKTVTAQDK